MKKNLSFACLLLVCALLVSPVYPQLKYGTDFTASDAVWQIVHVKVQSNMMGHYLEGIKKTWLGANEVARQLGQLEEYAIYANMLEGNGDYNLTLVTKYKDLEQYDKGRKEFKAFEEAWMKKMSEEEQDEIVKTYPNLREIVGEYLVRRLDLK